jgi:hypothetical protein
MQPNATTPNPLDLIVTRKDIVQSNTTAKDLKPKGDFNSNFTLYVALTPEYQKQKFCMGEGQKVQTKGVTYYSKFVGKLEPTPETVLQNFSRRMRLCIGI